MQQHPIPSPGSGLPTAEKASAREAWEKWVESIPKLTPDTHQERPVVDMETQELDLLGSIKAGYCFNFYFMNMASSYKSDVSPIKKIYYSANWCNYTVKVPFDTSNFLIPKALPKSVFLICRDGAWAGIPSQLKGGPCTLGLLTTLTPNITLLQEWKQNKQFAPKDLIQHSMKIVMILSMIGQRAREWQSRYFYLGWHPPKA